MIIRFDNHSNHDDCCASGRSASSTRAAVHAALTADPGLDCSGIEINTLGPYVVLTGYVRNDDEAVRALRIAEEIAGEQRVQNRMLHRYLD